MARPSRSALPVNAMHGDERNNQLAINGPPEKWLARARPGAQNNQAEQPRP